MAKQILSKEEKEMELQKARDILLATMDYAINNYQKLVSKDFNSDNFYNNMKVKISNKFQKGSLSILNQWLRDFTEQPRETKDFEYVRYIKRTTGYDFDIFEALKKRIEKIIENNKITTENQYRDAIEMIENLIHEEPVNITKIEFLERLMSEF